MSTSSLLSVRMRYRLEQLLGRGGMGAVYRAYDRLSGQQVALKLVQPHSECEHAAYAEPDSLGSAATQELSLNGLLSEHTQEVAAATRRDNQLETVAAELQAAQSERPSRVHIEVGAAERLRGSVWARLALAHEFRTLASVRHPHIISVLDYGFAARGQPFFTMELLENAQTLQAASKRLPVAQRAQLLVQLLGALSYLHRHSILHRDLKPGNVMVLSGSEGPQVKLLDFGLALARSHTQAKQRELLGTLSYMAPELFEGRPASEASDLFAVGVLAYELFARRHPFDRGDDADLIGAILRSEPDWEPLRKHAALLPVVRRLLSKAPADRPSADDALHELALAAGLPPLKETAALRESTLQAARFVGREEPGAAAPAGAHLPHKTDLDGRELSR